MSDRLEPIERQLQEQLAAVNRDLAEVAALQADKTRIEAALAALRAETPVANSFRPLTKARSIFLPPPTPFEATLVVLNATPSGLHIRQIIDGLWARGWFKDREYESLRGTIVGTLNLKSKEPDGPVEKIAPSTYRIRQETTQPDLALGGAGPG